MDKIKTINAPFSQNPAPSVRTRLPLKDGGFPEILAFSGLCEPGEHLALVFPAPEHPKNAVPLVRVHSECLTGDLFGSALCDCGAQLAEAKDKIAAEGGALLYLRQEGRGIGLINKLKAYFLQQAEGLDTFEANHRLGFGDDERSYTVAAEMLQALNMTRIRLLTNNFDKVASLREHGITVTKIIPTGCYETLQNQAYLKSKRERGHTL